MISSMGLLPEFGVFAKRAAPCLSLSIASQEQKKKSHQHHHLERRYVPLHRSRTAVKYDDTLSTSPPLYQMPRELSMSRRSLSPQQLALLDNSPRHRPKSKDYDSDGSVGSRNSRRSHRSLGSNVSMDGMGPLGSNLDTIGPFTIEPLRGDSEIKAEPERVPTVEEAVIDVATFLVDDYEARTRAPKSTAEILAGLDTEIVAERSPSPQFQSLPVFSIDPSQSILSEDALVMLRKASVKGCKVGLGTNWHDSVSLKDSTHDLKKSMKKSPLIETSDVDCAEAAYEIAKKLVLWSENIVVLGDQKSQTGAPVSLDFEDDLSELESREGSTMSEYNEGSSMSESGSEGEALNNNTSDSQWISATEYFERRRAEYMLSKLSFNPVVQEQAQATS